VIVGIWSGFVRIVRVTSEESFVRPEYGWGCHVTFEEKVGDSNA
jgi:hypothetical protein